MRRRVMCSLILTLYLLTAATALSQWVEREMTTQVLLREVPYDRFPNQRVEIPLSAVFMTTEGDRLYELYEGVGWEQGDRVMVLSSSNYQGDYKNGILYLNCDRDYRVVRSASRFPRVGEKVEIIDPIKLRDDCYLSIYKGSIPEPRDIPYGRLETGMEAVVQSESAMLVDVSRGLDPFLQHYAKGTSIITDAAERIFSLKDVESFLSQLPEVAALAALLIAPVTLWAWSCWLVRRERGALAALNAVLAVAAIAAVFWLLGRIDLPSSLMPTENILELDYYVQEMRTVAGALQELGNPMPEIPEAMEAARQSALTAAAAGLLAPLGVIALEAAAMAWSRRAARKREQQ